MASVRLVERLAEVFTQAGRVMTPEARSLLQKVNADPIANREYQARLAEQDRDQALQVAETADARAETAAVRLVTVKHRLARRAAQARRRRAEGNGVQLEPEVP